MIINFLWSLNGCLYNWKRERQNSLRHTFATAKLYTSQVIKFRQFDLIIQVNLSYKFLCRLTHIRQNVSLSLELQQNGNIPHDWPWKWKRGKWLSSDYFKQSGRDLYVHVAFLLVGILVHGYVPDDLSVRTVIQFPREKNSNSVI